MDITINETFDLSGYGGDMFNVKPAPMTFSMKVGADPASDGGKLLRDLFEKGFTPYLKKFVADKEKEYRGILKETEQKLRKSSRRPGQILDPESFLLEEAKTANVQIGQALKAFESLLRAEAMKIYDKIAEAIDKKYKTALKDLKVIYFLDIAWKSCIVVAAGAVAILATATGVAASAATMGAGTPIWTIIAPAVAASLLTCVKAGIDIGKTVASGLPSHKKSIAKLKTALSELNDAVAYEEKKKDKDKLGPKEKLKLLLGNVKGKCKAVEEAIVEVRIWQVKLAKDLEAFKVQLNKMEADLARASGDKVPKHIREDANALKPQINALQYKVKSTGDYFAQCETLMKESEGVLGKAEKMTPKTLGAIVGKMQTLYSSDVGQAFVQQMPGVLSNGQTIVKNIAKAV